MPNSLADLPEGFRQARVARLATVRPDGRPHQVPVVFACSGNEIYLPLDGKPKSGKRLQRLVNIEAQPQVCLLVDSYAEDWSQLWWVRVDGTAEATEDPVRVQRGHQHLHSKYHQYDTVRLDPLVLVVTPTRVASWSAS